MEETIYQNVNFLRWRICLNLSSSLAPCLAHSGHSLMWVNSKIMVQKVFKLCSRLHDFTECDLEKHKRPCISWRMDMPFFVSQKFHMVSCKISAEKIFHCSKENPWFYILCHLQIYLSLETHWVNMRTEIQLCVHIKFKISYTHHIKYAHICHCLIEVL